MLEYCSPNGVPVHKCSLSQIFGKFHIRQLDATHPATAEPFDNAVVQDGLIRPWIARELWMAISGVLRMRSQFRAQRLDFESRRTGKACAAARLNGRLLQRHRIDLYQRVLGQSIHLFYRER
jgi:hypothetical protein